MVSDLIRLLKFAPVFNGIPTQGLESLVKLGRLRVFQTGRYIVRQGGSGDAMHIILEGSVWVERTHPHLAEPLVLAWLGQGEVVAEMAVLTGEPRSASVTAAEETITLELGRAETAELLERYPHVAAAFLRLLSRRLGSTNELLAKLLTGDDEGEEAAIAIEPGSVSLAN